jgi:hypothetical protein
MEIYWQVLTPPGLISEVISSRISTRNGGRVVLVRQVMLRDRESSKSLGHGFIIVGF